MRVLVIDDDADLCAMIEELLRDAAFIPLIARDAASGLAVALSGACDIAVLDVMLPDSDGFSLLRQLRESSALPVLMLTARGQRSDRVAGLNLGADDYLAKPFEPDEFIARIHAILRRARKPAPGAGLPVEVGQLKLFPARREAVLAGERVDITDMQFELLELLMASAGEVVSRDAVSLKLYNRLCSPYERVVDVHIFHLRQALKHYGRFIASVRGVGYQFCPPAPGPS